MQRAHVSGGVALLVAGYGDRARAALERLMPWAPDADLSNALSDRAADLRADGLDEHALVLAQSAVALCEGNPRAHRGLGVALDSLGRHGDALVAYDQALALDEGSYVAHFNRGNTLSDLGRPAEALGAYDRAIELASAFAPAYFNRGNTLLVLERLEDALASYRRATELRPEFVDAHWNYGAVLRRLGRLEEARRAFQQVERLDPDDAAATKVVAELGAQLDAPGPSGESGDGTHRAEPREAPRTRLGGSR